MAEQAEETALLAPEDEGVATEDEAQAAEGKIKKLIPVLAIIPAVAALAFLLVTKVVNPRVASSADDVEVEVVDEEETEGVMWELGTKLANPLGSRTLRFIKVSVSLELASAELAKKVEAGRAKLEDCFLTILSSKTLEDIGTPEGKSELKQELMEAFTSDLRLEEGDIRRVYFLEFVVQ